MTCSTCGRDNPAHLTFCQECGQRLGPRIAPPTPPIGLSGGDDPPAPAIPVHQEPRNATSLGMTQADPFAGPARSPAPPPVATGAPKRCRVCETMNAPNLRYCTSCGSSLENVGAVPNIGAPAAAAPVPSPVPPPAAAAPLPAPADAIAVGRVVDLGSGPRAGVRTCGRCRGVVDSGAQFCKFCGASLADSGPHARA